MGPAANKDGDPKERERGQDRVRTGNETLLYGKKMLHLGLC